MRSRSQARLPEEAAPPRCRCERSPCRKLQLLPPPPMPARQGWLPPGVLVSSAGDLVSSGAEAVTGASDALSVVAAEDAAVPPQAASARIMQRLNRSAIKRFFISLIPFLEQYRIKRCCFKILLYILWNTPVGNKYKKIMSHNCRLSAQISLSKLQVLIAEKCLPSHWTAGTFEIFNYNYRIIALE